MTAWCNSPERERMVDITPAPPPAVIIGKTSVTNCPSCGYSIRCEEQGLAGCSSIQNLPGLPAGVKFDPTDQELLEHLEGKARPESQKLLHPLIDDFIPTIEGENGICYTHPEKLPGVSRDGLIRHFFHRPSKAYTTGTRKRRKVHTDEHGGETRWHKTGKTRPVFGAAGGKLRGYKKILVLYTNYGKQRKPEKTNWVMHQYHLGSDEEEKDGELVVSKVFYQTQPRQCGSIGGGAKEGGAIPATMKGLSSTTDDDDDDRHINAGILKDGNIINSDDQYNYCHSGMISYNQTGLQIFTNMNSGGASFLP